MTKRVQGRQRKRGRLWLALAMVVVILAVLFVPPLVSLSRYKSRIVQLMSASLGRPVRLSSVELRLLPRPCLELTDLTVDEDPAYGAEPVLHASTVTASFRLLALWRGRFEISRISVDEASLNLVRTDQGRWNLDSLFRTAAAHTGGASAGQPPAATGQADSERRAVPLPYLEATDSRINFKSGAEKLPLSLVNTDLSFWQEQPGDWRLRLRGQPARTDVSLDLADTGLVRLEASVRRAAELRELPVQLDLEWREAQLGQLARLIIGSDLGWRGDLTGELHLDGTADAAQIKTRLRATGVHRAEFAPAAPLDFDATCGFDYHFSSRALENLACDSPLGDGRIHFAGDLPGENGKAHFTVALDRIPVAAGLDALRTVRSGFAPGLVATGAISGKLAYAENSEPAVGASVAQAKRAFRSIRSKSRAQKERPALPGPLTGSLAIEGFQLSGDGLSTPIRAPKLVLEPVAAPVGQSQPAGLVSNTVPALFGSAAISAGGSSPLTVTSRLMLSGYQIGLRGQASFLRARELAHLAGTPSTAAFDSLAGDAVTVDLSAEGPWLPSQTIPFSNLSVVGAPPGPAQPSLSSNVASPTILLPMANDSPSMDSLTGTVTLHNANWKADFLASHVEIAKATLYIDPGALRWESVDFSYGPVKGTASLALPTGCQAPLPCAPRFDLQFGELDASALQSAILGAHEKGTLLSALIARLQPSTAPAWPQLSGTVEADSLILGPVTLHDASATLTIDSTGAQIDDLTGDLLGGNFNGSGTFARGDQPIYTLEGDFEKLSPAAVGQLVGLRCSGGEFNAEGKVELTGFADKDLATSAKGTLHFEWRHGSVAGAANQPIAHPALLLPVESAPAALARFDRWTADAEIANGTITLKPSQVQQGSHRRVIGVTVALGDPPVVTFTDPNAILGKKR
jgi:hypothetical protein